MWLRGFLPKAATSGDKRKVLTTLHYKDMMKALLNWHCFLDDVKSSLSILKIVTKTGCVSGL